MTKRAFNRLKTGVVGPFAPSRVDCIKRRWVDVEWCVVITSVGMKGGKEAGRCQVLKPGQGLVHAKGWCNSWVQNPNVKI